MSQSTDHPLPRVASAGMALVLLGLACFALWTALATHEAVGRATQASLLSEDFQEARYQVAEENVLAYKYRLAPSPALLAQYQAAARSVRAALQAARRDGDAGDRALADALGAAHAAYLRATRQHLFAAGVAHQTPAARARASAVVDPLVRSLVDRMDAAVDVEHQEALGQLAALARIQDGVLAARPLIFALSGALLLVLWRVLRAYRRHLDAAARRELEHAASTAQAEQRAIRKSEARFRALVQNSSDLIAVVDPAGRIAYVSPAIEPLLGYAREEVLGTNWATLVHPDDALHLRHRATEPGARSTLEVRGRHRDGSVRQLEVITTNLRDEPGIAGTVINARDITERKAFEEQLQHQAFHDALTALPNRALFLDRLEHALAGGVRHGSGVGVLFLDLDRFKVVNDSLGHGAGDQLLVAVASRLSACVRKGDTVARLGGDEFAVLLRELKEAPTVVRTAERILQTLEAPIRLDGHDVVVATSIGIVTSTPAHTPQGMLRDADVALYRAKAKGRGRYEVFDETMNVRALERLELEADLRQALERDEFEVHYQPKVALATGRLAGMEALVRWRHPQRGLVAPAAFIPLAEETGLIRPIGQWVLEEACRQTRAWREQWPDLALVTSVNLSARQFQQPTLVAEVARALQASGVDPACIELEITESAVMDDAETTITTLASLKGLGVQLAIDDFGTGYSSLGYLQRFPVDVLKIDRSFVAGLRRDNAEASIVDAVVSLGHALQLAVVAEGVETAAESRQLQELGCDLAQGYYFARPLPLEQAEAYLRQQRQRAA